MVFMFVAVIGGPFLVAALSAMIALEVLGTYHWRAVLILLGAAIEGAGGVLLFSEENLSMTLMLAASAGLLVVVASLLKADLASPSRILIWSDLTLPGLLLTGVLMFSSFSYSI